MILDNLNDELVNSGSPFLILQFTESEGKLVIDMRAHKADDLFHNKVENIKKAFDAAMNNLIENH